MTNYLKIKITDPDPDYLGIEISASSSRFSGATGIYAGQNQLSELADTIAGFPISAKDDRSYKFGTKEKGYAGGFCELRFFCRGSTGHAAVNIDIEDDNTFYSEANARFTIPVLPADIDEFVKKLKLIEQAQSGEVEIENKG